MGLVIADNGVGFTLTFGNGDTANYPKNSGILKRRDDNFTFTNGNDGQTKLFGFDYSDVTTPAVGTSALLEAALLTIMYA